MEISRLSKLPTEEQLDLTDDNQSIPTSKPIDAFRGSTYSVGGYLIGQIIGSGSYSTVKVAQEKVTGEFYALKIIKKGVCEWLNNQIRREIEITRNHNSPYIIKQRDCFQTARHIYLVLDYCPGGDLFEYLSKYGKPDRRKVERWFYQLCLAVKYLHEHDYVHRDIKPENLLIDHENNLVLSDFGFVSVQGTGELVYHVCGTRGYTAPEVFTSENGYCGKAVDIWSLGVTLYLMLTGETLYSDCQEIQFRDGTIDLKKKLLLEINDRLFLEWILKEDPDRRPTIEEICLLLEKQILGKHLREDQ